MSAQADVAIGVARRVKAFKLNVLAHLDHITGLHTAVHARNFGGSFVVGNDFGPSCSHHGHVSANMVVMLMRVENLGDLPALGFGCAQAFFMVQRINGQCFARVRAGNQVIEVAQTVACPDSFNDHCWPGDKEFIETF